MNNFYKPKYDKNWIIRKIVRDELNKNIYRKPIWFTIFNI